MFETLGSWLVELPQLFAKFGEWLTDPLPYINVSPLAVFSVAGVSVLLGFKLVRLVVGG